ncbi:hypothetical protein IL54_0507 [Sphingobium sp. ba1]|nr:hypothetical protein IL54_0507 [Sphingobium sp. ba1]
MFTQGYRLLIVIDGAVSNGEQRHKVMS